VIDLLAAPGCKTYMVALSVHAKCGVAKLHRLVNVTLSRGQTLRTASLGKLTVRCHTNTELRTASKKNNIVFFCNTAFIFISFLFLAGPVAPNLIPRSETLSDIF
jgi:hypothetical protein